MSVVGRFGNMDDMLHSHMSVWGVDNGGDMIDELLQGDSLWRVMCVYNSSAR